MSAKLIELRLLLDAVDGQLMIWMLLPANGVRTRETGQWPATAWRLPIALF
jgi:hypothetical protein